MRARLRHVIPLALLCAAPAAAEAQSNVSCRVSSPALVFPVYDPVSGADARAQGPIAVACDRGNPQVRVSLSAGRSGTSAQRAMTAPGAATPLLYNLYKDGGLTAIWGDGDQALTVVVRAKDPDPIVYGRIFANQGDVEAGSYSDTLTVTIEY